MEEIKTEIINYKELFEAYEHKDYVCTLPQKYLEIAEKELGETEAKRNDALDQIRAWLIKHPHIKRCRLDSPFLLRFLRKRKFNVPLACETLERFLMCRQFYPHWFQKIDINESKIQSLTDNGAALILRERDHLGRRIVMAFPQTLDPNLYTGADIVRFTIAFLDLIQSEEISQVTGVICIVDGSHTKLSQARLFSLSEINLIYRANRSAGPLRVKHCYFINLPPFAVLIADLVAKLSNKKMKERMHFLKTVEELHEFVDPRILPKEYGGTIPMAEMRKDFKQNLNESRDFFLEANNHTETNFKSMKSSLNLKSHEFSACESIKKLNLD